jgi:hypothetical protein
LNSFVLAALIAVAPKRQSIAEAVDAWEIEGAVKFNDIPQIAPIHLHPDKWRDVARLVLKLGSKILLVSAGAQEHWPYDG